MENLTISDPPPQQHGGPHAGPGGMPPSLGRAPPAPQQQLPAQMFTTAAQLLDLTDSRRLSLGCHPCLSAVTNSLAIEKLMLALRDGRKLVGILRSWDQFGMSHHMRHGK